MTEVSRNAPCPCGSGKKHKKCCLKPSEAQPVVAETQRDAVALVRFRDADRTGALEKLTTFAERSEFRDDLQAAQEEFGGDDMETVFDDPTGQVGFVTWSIYDYPVRGHTLCDRFLQARGAQLTPAERRYLQSMSGTRMGLYTASDVRMHEGFTLKDLAGDDRYDIHEEKATEQISDGDIIALRVAPGASGGYEIDGAIYVFEPGDVDALVLDLRAAEERGRFKQEAAIIINRRYMETRYAREALEDPLSRDELDTLKDFLYDDDCARRLPFVACEGFFVALHSGPEMIPPSEWLPVVLGGDEPIPESLDELQGSLELLMRFYNSIGTMLWNPDVDFEPTLVDKNGAPSTAAAVVWAMGYVKAIHLRSEAWEPLENDPERKPLVPIYDLATCMQLRPQDPLDSDENKMHAAELVDCIYEIYDFWNERPDLD